MTEAERIAKGHPMNLIERITSAEGGSPLPRTYPAIFARALSRVRHRAALTARGVS